jgi:hypothetical protein
MIALKVGLATVTLFGIAAAIMIPVSIERGENLATVFWMVQFLAMSICFVRISRRLTKGSD